MSGVSPSMLLLMSQAHLSSHQSGASLTYSHRRALDCHTLSMIPSYVLPLVWLEVLILHVAVSLNIDVTVVTCAMLDNNTVILNTTRSRRMIPTCDCDR